MPRAVVTDHVFENLEPTRRVLSHLGVEVLVAPDTSEATLTELTRDAAALIVCYAPISKVVLQAAAAGGCKVVVRTGIGVDNIDVQEATTLGIQVANVPDYCLDEVADHTMALLLAVSRKVVEARQVVEEGGWTPPHDVHRLRGRRLAVIGVGAIGERVAARARAFGFDVVGFDPFRSVWVGSSAEPVGSVDEAVIRADAISLHTPLTDETHHLIDDELLRKLECRPVLVNTARGGLVDLDAVVRALDGGLLEAACLDVTDPEPPPSDHPIRKHPRALLTPHMSFFSIEAQADLQQRAAEEVERALRGAPPRSPVNVLTTQAVS
jgi:D-3-phosphoglycerate dehydrogenase